MNSASEILVIILSIFLAIFLILGIILTIYLIRLSHDIREVTKSAGRTVNAIESTISNVTKFASPLFVAELIGRYVKKFKKGKKGD
jgi:uncharacterized protein YoxC